MKEMSFSPLGWFQGSYFLPRQGEWVQMPILKPLHPAAQGMEAD